MSGVTPVSQRTSTVAFAPSSSTTHKGWPCSQALCIAVWPRGTARSTVAFAPSSIRKTGAWPCFYEWLLDERGAAVRRLLSENGVPCTERVALDKVDDAYAADLLRREPSPLYEALKQLDPGADLELADEVRVACNSLNSKGWKWKGREGLEPYLEVLIGLLKDRSDGLLACAERLARATSAAAAISAS